MVWLWSQKIKIYCSWLVGIAWTHCMNLTIQTLSYMLNIVRKIKDMFQSLYVYFFHSPKRIQVFIELANIVETWSKHILMNIKIGWISMLLLIKRVLRSKHDKYAKKIVLTRNFNLKKIFFKHSHSKRY